MHSTVDLEAKEKGRNETILILGQSYRTEDGEFEHVLLEMLSIRPESYDSCVIC